MSTIRGQGPFDDKGNLIRTVYVGQTETARFDTRMQEHMNTGRYHGGLQAYVITRTDTYGQARGAEQYPHRACEWWRRNPGHLATGPLVR